MTEEWREIPGTDYSVSSEGRVASRKKGGWRVMKGSPDSRGYMCVCLRGGGGQRTAKVHRLVAEAFLGSKPSPKHEINHKNGTRDDPRVANLEWVTSSENRIHRYSVLKHGAARGKKASCVKVAEEDVREMRVRYAAGELQRAIAADYGIHQTAVSLIVRRVNWAWLK